MTMPTGEVLGGRYRLTSKIATGGMGEVWRGEDVILGRQVAVKLLKHEYAGDADFVERFRGEARHSAGLSHPNIAAVYDYGEADGLQYLVMELVPGEPLSAIISREGAIDPVRTLTLVGQTASGLHAAHVAGIIHRDVKPGNILVTDDDHVKVTDFGVARAGDAVPLTQTGTIVGTAHYLSPEQGRGAGVTPASDVYSLGVVAYECLVGRRPFEGTAVQIAMAHVHHDPPPLPESVPEQVRMLVEQAMAKNPEHRFATAGAFARACMLLQERLCGDVAEPLADAVATRVLPAVETESDHGIPRRRQPVSRRTRVLVALALGLVLLVALGVATTRPEMVTVPAVNGAAVDVAEAALRRAGLKPVRDRAPDDRVTSGRVISSDPKQGVTAEKGDSVTLLVSTGPPPVALPAGLIGKNADEVERVLTGRGLNVTRTTALSALPTGSVIEIKPATGLRKGFTVTLVVDVPPRDDDNNDGKGKGRGKGND